MSQLSANDFVKQMILRIQYMLILSCRVNKYPLPEAIEIEEYGATFFFYWMHRSLLLDPFLYFNRQMVMELILRECAEDIFTEPQRYRNWIQNKSEIYFSSKEINFIQTHLLP